jgi:hypothetical protein
MRVIFLDIDGVLNSKTWYRQFLCAGEQVPSPALDPTAVARLDRIVRETGAKIVLSSAWRGNPDVPRWLSEHGCCGKVIGKTPYLYTADGYHRERGYEIGGWIRQHADKTGVIPTYVILDDDNDMVYLAPRLVRTDPIYGLRDVDVERAITKLLGSEPAQASFDMGISEQNSP